MFRTLFFTVLLLIPVGLRAEVTLLRSPNTETEVAVTFLQKIPQPDQQYIRFFSFYAIPEELRQNAVLTLSFIIHNLAGISDHPEGNAGSFYPLAKMEINEKGERVFVPYRQVSETLYWIDLRDYNWSDQAWEDVSGIDGYFVEPIVQNKNAGILRLLAGNAILRADWFIYYASDVNLQVDRDEKVKIYRRLLYSQTKEPKTLDEFEKIWGLDNIELSRKRGNESAVLVTKSDEVARNNRLMFGYRTEMGWLYKTYDVKNQDGLRNYRESITKFGGLPPPSNAFDAGEVFATNQLQLQVYDLYDNKGNLVDFGDPTVVRHTGDMLGDVRVRVAHSCYDCHAGGPIPSENTLKEMLDGDDIKFYVPTKEEKLRYDRVFLSDKFEESVEENKRLFAKALAKTNGLSPDENARAYNRIIQWYDKPLNLEQAAHECGVSLAKFKARMLEGKPLVGRGQIPATLALLLKNKENVPRDIWDSRGRDGIPGMFQQAMIIINGLTKVEEVKEIIQEKDRIIIPEPEIEPQIDGRYMTIIRNGGLQSGFKTLKNLRVGDRVEFLDEEQRTQNVLWYKVMFDGTAGWVDSRILQLE